MKLAAAFAAGFVIAALLTTYLHRLSRKTDRFADPVPLDRGEAIMQAMGDGRSAQMRPDDNLPIEVEIAYDEVLGKWASQEKPIVERRVVLRYFPHFVSALADLANDPDIQSDGFAQIVITNTEE